MGDHRVLLVPGLHNSGAGHWQTLWEQADPATFTRVVQREWDAPACADCVEAIEQAVVRAGASVVLAAHSLGCIAIAHWAMGRHSPVRGALLVAPPDPERPDFPTGATGFAPVPKRPLGFPSILVASTNDPYGSFAHAEACAAGWGSRLVNLGPAGHINTASGLGPWPDGLALLKQLTG